jgi:hypothetical protein
MSDGPESPGDAYPRTWLLVDVADRTPRLLGSEVVDLSPGALELRRMARELRDFAEEPSRFLAMSEESNVSNAPEGHRRNLSFGPDVRYLVEHDPTGRIHGGDPFRHLSVHCGSRILTPATAAEIGLYFYGRRPAVFGRPAPHRSHGFIGMEWQRLDAGDVAALLERERRSSYEG